MDADVARSVVRLSVWWGYRGFKEFAARKRFVAAAVFEEMFDVLVPIWEGRCPFCGRALPLKSIRVHLLWGKDGNRCKTLLKLAVDAAMASVARNHGWLRSRQKILRRWERRERRGG